MFGSITGDPVQLREFPYLKSTKVSAAISGHAGEKVALVFHDRHAIHHVHERGYVESPMRVRSILAEIAQGTLFEILPAATFPEKAIFLVMERITQGPTSGYHFVFVDVSVKTMRSVHVRT